MTRRPDWSRPLPQTLTIPGVMTLRTLADVRAFIGHVPKARRELNTWQIVTRALNEAAAGSEPMAALAPLWIVLQLERVPFRFG